jgi:uncharacterized membrane protein
MRVISAATVLGIGLGGFLDGIVLHQIAQWHNMGSAVVPPVTMDAMRRNMAWDGLFHLTSWSITLAGILMLRHEGRTRGVPASIWSFVGQMVFGWGTFNLVEGIIDHHILSLHHVRDMPAHVPLYDWVFLGVGGAGTIVLGLLMARAGRRHVSA